jgi:hypothetical protein
VDFLDDPEDMTPEARLAEVATILAAGYARHPRLPSTENPLDSLATPMPLCGEEVA